MNKRIIVTISFLVFATCTLVLVLSSGKGRMPVTSLEGHVRWVLQDNDCFVCHSYEPEKPFYASFPVIGKKMQEHMIHAVRFVELEEASENLFDAGEAFLAKLEHAVKAGSMPIKEYRMIHWGSTVNKKEKAILLDWIRLRRAQIVGDETTAKSILHPVPSRVRFDEAKADLGERMYNDTRISLDNTISCASCHILADGGADHEDERVSEGINGNHGGVNAPTVYNAVFNIRQFWNGRAADLKEQAAGPPVNPMEMGDQTWDQIVDRLRLDGKLCDEFEALYPGEGLTQSSVTDAIAEYEKTLITPGSRFDMYLKGDRASLNGTETIGYRAFVANSCAACHVGKNVGGQSFEYLGIYGDYFADRDPAIERNADDDGLKGFTGEDRDLEKFKVPGLRNVALTAPYFHDGSYDSLEDAVKAMYKYQLGKTASDEEVASVTAFLKTLTGKHPELKR